MFLTMQACRIDLLLYLQVERLQHKFSLIHSTLAQQATLQAAPAGVKQSDLTERLSLMSLSDSARYAAATSKTAQNRWEFYSVHSNSSMYLKAMQHPCLQRHGGMSWQCCRALCPCKLALSPLPAWAPLTQLLYVLMHLQPLQPWQGEAALKWCYSSRQGRTRAP